MVTAFVTLFSRTLVLIITLFALVLYLILGIIVGGRLGYIFFYNYEYYTQNPYEILKIWKGGMAFHGGLIGVILSTLFFSLKNKISFFIFSKSPSVI